MCSKTKVTLTPEQIIALLDSRELDQVRDQTVQRIAPLLAIVGTPFFVELFADLERGIFKALFDTDWDRVNELMEQLDGIQESVSPEELERAHQEALDEDFARTIKGGFIEAAREVFGVRN